MSAEEPRFKVLAFSRNFGHQLAITAGIDKAEGDAVVIIDADLQDPPEVIQAMIARWRSGFDVVFGVRRSRAGETIFKKLTAALFYRNSAHDIGWHGHPGRRGRFSLDQPPSGFDDAFAQGETSLRARYSHLGRLQTERALL